MSTRPRERNFRKQKIKDWLVIGAALLGLVLLVTIVLGALWARVWAPCDWIDWLPVRDVPARCLHL